MVAGPQWVSRLRFEFGRVRRWPPLRALTRLVQVTVAIALRYRVTALAAEVGFFALLSLPPLVLALAASAARIAAALGVGTEMDLERAVQQYLTPFLTQDVVDSVILPTLTDALNTPRYDVISIGFVLSLWSGSRALNVYIDTISIMYGLAGHRSIVRARLLSFVVYLVAMLLGAVAMPLVLLGPDLLSALLPSRLGVLMGLYWPVVGLAGVVSIAWLFHISTPLRTAWWRNLPGAVLGLVIWILASGAFRTVLSVSLAPSGGPTRSMSIYGPLTTPIIVLLWLYLLAVAVLIGAALNAAIDQLWPDGERSARRAEVAEELAREAGRGITLTPVRDVELEKRQQSRALGAAAVLRISRSDRSPDGAEPEPTRAADPAPDPDSGETGRT